MLVWLRDDYVVEYLGDEFYWWTIDIGGFGAWLLTWVADEMKICTWCRFALTLRRSKLDGVYKKPQYGSL